MHFTTDNNGQQRTTTDNNGQQQQQKVEMRPSLFHIRTCRLNGLCIVQACEEWHGWVGGWVGEGGIDLNIAGRLKLTNNVFAHFSTNDDLEDGIDWVQVREK
jgi:hypothetical protein